VKTEPADSKCLTNADKSSMSKSPDGQGQLLTCLIERTGVNICLIERTGVNICLIERTCVNICVYIN